jgi:hypothetical protein
VAEAIRADRRRSPVPCASDIYLLLAKRLFGLRGGAAAGEAESEHDRGWEALERTTPPTPSLS